MAGKRFEARKSDFREKSKQKQLVCKLSEMKAECEFAGSAEKSTRIIQSKLLNENAKNSKFALKMHKSAIRCDHIDFFIQNCNLIHFRLPT